MVRPLHILALFILVFVTRSVSYATWLFDIESGVIFGDYNNVTVPTDSGTYFSITRDLAADDTSYIRLRVGYIISDAHYVGALFAPLQYDAMGVINRTIRFNDSEFTAGSVFKSKYRSGLYGLTYRYILIRKPKFEMGIGAAIELRDAEISLSTYEASSVVPTTDIMPMMNFTLRWNVNRRVSFNLECDATALPGKRMEDVFLGIGYWIGPNLSMKGGYRMIEGGVNSEDIDNSTLSHFAAIGVIISI